MQTSVRRLSEAFWSLTHALLPGFHLKTLAAVQHQTSMQFPPQVLLLYHRASALREQAYQFGPQQQRPVAAQCQTAEVVQLGRVQMWVCLASQHALLCGWLRVTHQPAACHQSYQKIVLQQTKHTASDRTV